MTEAVLAGELAKGECKEKGCSRAKSQIIYSWFSTLYLHQHLQTKTVVAVCYIWLGFGPGIWSKLLAGKYRRNACKKGEWWRINLGSGFKMCVFHQTLHFITIPWSCFQREIIEFPESLVTSSFPTHKTSYGQSHRILTCIFLFLFFLDKVLWATSSNPVGWLLLFHSSREKKYYFWLQKNLSYPTSWTHEVFPCQGLLPNEVSPFRCERCSLLFCWKSCSKMQWYTSTSLLPSTEDLGRNSLMTQIVVIDTFELCDWWYFCFKMFFFPQG